MNKFLKGFFLLSARQKIHFLNGGCDTCLTKEQIIPVRTGVHVPSLAGYVGKKLYVDLVSMSETIIGNQYMLIIVDINPELQGFIKSCQEILITTHLW